MSKFEMYITSILRRYVIIMDGAVIDPLTVKANDAGTVSIGETVFDRHDIAYADWGEDLSGNAYYMWYDNTGERHEIYLMRCDSLDAMHDLKNELYDYD